MANVSNGQKTCGHCNDVTLSHGDKYGSLTYSGRSIEIGVGSHKLLQFTCSCGNVKGIQAKLVFSEKVKSCGKRSKMAMNTLGSGIWVRLSKHMPTPRKSCCSNANAEKLAKDR
jgi:hypothetical protein